MPLAGKDWGIRLHGVKGTQNFLRRLQDELGERSSIRKKIGQKAVLIIVNRTRVGNDMHGRAFTANKKGTNPLYDTGMMVNATAYRTQGFKILVYVRRVGNRWIVAEVHNFGMISGRQGARFKMPKREWFGLSARDLDDLKMMIQRHFEKVLTQLGGRK